MRTNRLRSHKTTTRHLLRTHLKYLKYYCLLMLRRLLHLFIKLSALISRKLYNSGLSEKVKMPLQRNTKLKNGQVFLLLKQKVNHNSMKVMTTHIKKSLSFLMSIHRYLLIQMPRTTYQSRVQHQNHGWLFPYHR